VVAVVLMGERRDMLNSVLVRFSALRPPGASESQSFIPP